VVWRADGPKGNEVGKMLWELVPYTRGFGLDIGCGPHKGFPHFVGVDSRKDTALFNIQMNPEITVEDASRLPQFADGACDFVFSSHLLEHIVDYKTALAEWWRLVKVGGHLCLYLPHKDFYPNVGKPGSNEDHKHDFLPQDILDAMEGFGGDWDCLRNEDRNEREEYSFFQVFRKLEAGAGRQHTWKKPRPEKLAAVVRYGAWGDALQTCSVFPGLKKQGFHIRLYTTPRAWDVLQHDPHIDEVYLQDTDQVPPQHLGTFWDYERVKYDRWINLSESVEATWLTLGDRVQARWPKSVRDKYLNTNYVEFQHELAEIVYTKSRTKFYASLEEKNWAVEQRIEMKASPLILWVLNGSSVHKVWPHIDQIFARMMLVYPECKIVTVGDAKSLILDEPWKNEPRIIRKAGQWSIRQTLAFAQVCDLIVGPETGVLSGMSMEDMPKIVFLSHSSHENLTRDWKNTFALFSTKTPCYPCHKMHYNWDHCNRNDDKDAYWEGTAQCQVDIPPEACWVAIGKALNGPNVIHVPIPREKLGASVG
jgi:ADP-heptose:LPS heptosyltransferase/predicted SAM-dependent methyltransferase